VEGDLDNVINAAGCLSPDAFTGLGAAEAGGVNDVVGARLLRDRHITFGTHRRDHRRPCLPSEGDGTLSDGPGAALHKDEAPFHGTGDMDRAVGGDSGDAKTRSLFG
jgi:hypothetical protein